MTPETSRSRLARCPVTLLWIWLTASFSTVSALGAETELESLLSSEVYSAAGIGKLNPAERQALLEYLQSCLVGGELTPVETATAVAPSTADFGLPEPKAEPRETAELHARVLEPFNGWSGKTLFRLDNGQLWKQRAAGKYNFRGEDTRVVISKNGFGFYELRLLAADRRWVYGGLSRACTRSRGLASIGDWARR